MARALALDPEHLLSTYNLALAYRPAGRVDEAILAFERTQARDPRRGHLRHPRGRAGVHAVARGSGTLRLTFASRACGTRPR